MTLRLLAPSTGIKTTVGHGHDQTFSAKPGEPLDVSDYVGQVLCQNGWVMPGRLKGVGPTSSRPTFVGVAGAGAGFTFLDETLGRVIVYDGADWRDPATGEAV